MQKKWATPKLIVLVRDSGAAHTLAVCKMSTSSDGPASYADGEDRCVAHRTFWPLCGDGETPWPGNPTLGRHCCAISTS